MIELGCGPGSVVPSILRKYGESIEIVGIDFSRQMIDLANRKQASNGWRNVQFKCMDMYDFSPTKNADSVVFCGSSGFSVGDFSVHPGSVRASSGPGYVSPFPPAST